MTDLVNVEADVPGDKEDTNSKGRLDNEGLLKEFRKDFAKQEESSKARHNLIVSILDNHRSRLDGHDVDVKELRLEVKSERASGLRVPAWSMVAIGAIALIIYIAQAWKHL